MSNPSTQTTNFEVTNPFQIVSREETAEAKLNHSMTKFNKGLQEAFDLNYRSAQKIGQDLYYIIKSYGTSAVALGKDMQPVKLSVSVTVEPCGNKTVKYVVEGKAEDLEPAELEAAINGILGGFYV